MLIYNEQDQIVKYTSLFAEELTDDEVDRLKGYIDAYKQEIDRLQSKIPKKSKQIKPTAKLNIKKFKLKATQRGYALIVQNIPEKVLSQLNWEYIGFDPGITLKWFVVDKYDTRTYFITTQSEKEYDYTREIVDYINDVLSGRKKNPIE